ncbi:hypothetical protein A2334_02820 [Candidatus Roizmanbacteria bacterium RIFOXYB2_FULL_38_10]|uniref:ATP synthase subunit b n=1 Tax=Candidatus Roizmanbacteria bacterium RIFOXYD1_FULL_38_12 TaxID=1802093 RepID=A0A1F7L0E6_9BACT|nr:MAG: hypothetical protein A3K47_02180 [Candidatus Roizmanbacteria bacterium RIFOXYA2_FULL_38_14]OGK63585.1 MAG: hypothetical protein A3K27_02180 [Candidatus Roizmanbacteria bacterium RIFOXYA1_FULL_37_12]OGK65431.1 MAG: hypothetical protein A3K38_02180 [Candidatus Roizmanbacteria bacterium RIFOXYB1_FULL_40_23]OGK69092.1 MAG: hypothetical protein A2334_02820 [Candidatus Roizmanbacteria bacterium RIFOXYB2_FULL_38_10]OGK69836.1 MAG: hypothetical protein A3K21_02185 [Candidatus Roizmanbacteria ba
MDKLGVDIKLLVAQLTNFALFFFIFQKFIAKPFLHFIKNEEKKDKERIKFQEEMSNQKELMIKEEAKNKEELNKQVKNILDEAKKEADVIKKSLIEQARKEAADLAQDSKKQLAEEARLMDQSLKRKAADLSVILVKQALKDYLNENAQKDITSQILSRLPNQHN